MNKQTQIRLLTAAGVALLVTFVALIISLENLPAPDLHRLYPVASEPFRLVNVTVDGSTGAIVHQSKIAVVPVALFFLGWTGALWLVLVAYDKFRGQT